MGDIITTAASNDWLGAASTVFAAGIGVAAIVWQIARQGKLNRDSVAENERRRLKSRMYEGVEAVCQTFYDAQAAYVASVLTACAEIRYAAYSHASGHRYALPQTRIMAVSDHRTELQRANATVVGLIEQSQFISPQITVFRTALAAVLFDADEIYSQRFFDKAMRSLPVDNPDGSGIYDYTPPSPEDADALHDIGLSIIASVQQGVAFVTDFSVEMQNLLVADLFGTVVPHREPYNPTAKVIRLDDAKELEKHFLEDTRWGRMVLEEEAKAKARFASPPQETD